MRRLKVKIRGEGERKDTVLLVDSQRTETETGLR